MSRPRILFVTYGGGHVRMVLPVVRALQARGTVDVQVLALTTAHAFLAREGIATEGYFSKSWEDLPQVPDIVISVCGNAANETCPAYLGPVLRTHWGVEDPAHATGTDEEIDAAFMTAYRILRARIEAFFALPLAELQHNPAQLKAEMDRIASEIV